jgi:hypothetical protein
MEAESTVLMERAVVRDSAAIRERAATLESTVESERAGKDEGAATAERADMGESAWSCERAGTARVPKRESAAESSLRDSSTTATMQNRPGVLTLQGGMWLCMNPAIGCARQDH